MLQTTVSADPTSVEGTAPAVDGLRTGASEHAILQAVVRAASEFLQKSELEASLNDLLEGIGNATRASRVYVFENDPRVDGEPLTATECAEWTAPTVVSEMGKPEVQRISLETGGFRAWADAFANGKPFVAVTSELPPEARARLESVEVLSIAAVPIFVDDEYWGFIGVDNCVTERRWSHVEVDALSAAAVIIGAAVGRRRVDEDLRNATVQAQLAADIGEVVTGAGDTLQQMLDRCCAAIVRRLQPDLLRIWMMSESLECLVACTAAGAASIQRYDSPDMAMISNDLKLVASRHEPTFWHDGLPELWPGSAKEFAESGVRTGVGFPLVTNGRVAGVAVLLGREFPPKAMIDALESVTDEIALAIERHHVQGAATRAELRYRRLVEATVEGIVIHDGARVVDANPSFATMVGYTLDEVLGRYPFDFIPEEYHEFVFEQLKANYTEAYEVEGIRKDGTRFPVELKGSDFMDQGRTLRVAAVRDISDRKKVERTTAQLREEQHARALAERTRAHAQFLSDASRILASSLDTATAMSQLAHLAVPILADYCVVSTHAIGGVARQVVAVHSDPEKQPLLRAAVAAWPEVFPDTNPIFHALNQGKSLILPSMDDETLDRVSGSPQHRAVIQQLGSKGMLAVPIISNGTILGGIMFSSTNPERRYGDEELALGEELAHRAGQAMQTARSYLAAQAAARARDEMLAVVAHDLRNPLNTIFMGSELALELLGGTEASPGVRQLEIIRRSARHMNRLIQDLLDAGRIDSGNLALELVTLKPVEVLNAACEMLGPLAAHERIALNVVTDETLPPLNADKGRLLQVLSNLVGNALKFTPKDGRITVSAVAWPDDVARKDVVRFSVQDTGPGIPAEQLPYIFGRFWQAKHADRRGIGLGLAIASGIVEAHGGRIWVDSTPGEGSTFHFTVPHE